MASILKEPVAPRAGQETKRTALRRREISGQVAQLRREIKNLKGSEKRLKLAEEAAWFTQRTMLGKRSDMEQIAEAIRKIQRHARELARA